MSTKNVAGKVAIFLSIHFIFYPFNLAINPRRQHRIHVGVIAVYVNRMLKCSCWTIQSATH